MEKNDLRENSNEQLCDEHKNLHKKTIKTLNVFWFALIAAVTGIALFEVSPIAAAIISFTSAGILCGSAALSITYMLKQKQIEKEMLKRNNEEIKEIQEEKSQTMESTPTFEKDDIKLSVNNVEAKKINKTKNKTR